LYSVQFTDSNRGWIVGDLGIIILTTDGGTNWDFAASGTTDVLRSVHFINEITGWAVGEDGTILKSSNGGINWSSDTSGTRGWLYSVHFTDYNSGCWAVGEGGAILHTTNSGTIPVELTSFTASTSRGKVFLNWSTATELNNLGFEIERKIIQSESSEEWIIIGFREGYGTTTEPQKYSYVDDIRTVITKSLAYRLKQIDYNGSYEYSDEVFVDNPAPTDFVLEQNHPNPFNPTTKIKYQIPELSFVTLKVYDVLGNEVATLVDEELPAGEYEVEFEGRGLSSGLYFYKLSAGNFIETKKMILMK